MGNEENDLIATDTEAAAEEKIPIEQPSSGASSEEKTAQPKQPILPPWPEFLRNATSVEIIKRFSNDVRAILLKHNAVSSQYCCLAIMDAESAIDSYELDRIFNALSGMNAHKERDVLLILLSTGGRIEPAYQISKLCKSFAKRNFIVAVPRQAKSAATLIAIGADQIHMGPLGQLGPIDPQLGGLPALGVLQALESIARLSERYPKSSEMFARYLRLALTVEQIGYCERISESAAQYAERLLQTKSDLSEKAPLIAKELVHEYKDHGFVIDLDEAQKHLGSGWILSDTPEINIAEEIYRLYDLVNLFLGIHQNKRILIIGDIETDVIVFDKPRR